VHVKPEAAAQEGREGGGRRVPSPISNARALPRTSLPHAPSGRGSASLGEQEVGIWPALLQHGELRRDSSRADAGKWRTSYQTSSRLKHNGGSAGEGQQARKRGACLARRTRASTCLHRWPWTALRAHTRTACLCLPRTLLPTFATFTHPPATAAPHPAHTLLPAHTTFATPATSCALPRTARGGLCHIWRCVNVGDNCRICWATCAAIS